MHALQSTVAAPTESSQTSQASGKNCERLYYINACSIPTHTHTWCRRVFSAQASASQTICYSLASILDNEIKRNSIIIARSYSAYSRPGLLICQSTYGNGTVGYMVLHISPLSLSLALHLSLSLCVLLRRTWEAGALPILIPHLPAAIAAHQQMRRTLLPTHTHRHIVYVPTMVVHNLKFYFFMPAAVTHIVNVVHMLWRQLL